MGRAFISVTASHLLLHCLVHCLNHRIIENSLSHSVSDRDNERPSEKERERERESHGESLAWCKNALMVCCTYAFVVANSTNPNPELVVCIVHEGDHKPFTSLLT